MTSATAPSPAPWTYGYNPYMLQQPGAEDKELPAFEVFDADGTRVFNTNEDLPADTQEANACLATAAPKLLAALITCANLLADYDEQYGEEGDAYREAIAAIAEATTGRIEP
jgi:hypothetical protein